MLNTLEEISSKITKPLRSEKFDMILSENVYEPYIISNHTIMQFGNF
jgi:hypothetical protein